MAATHNANVLEGLVEGYTYQVGTSPARPDGTGGVRWNFFDYRRGDSGGLIWHQVATCVTVTFAADYYRDFALSWLRSLGHDPDAIDVILVLPDGVERIGRKA